MSILAKLFGAPVPGVAAQEAAARLDKYLIVDVRQPIEFRHAHIAGARSVPLAQVERRAGELPRDREILCVCQTGHRSGPAGRILMEAGLKVVELRGGMNAWRRAGLPTTKE